ncbi:MAG: signal peptidase I [Clostridia bacterium]|nr:signal peptidase I [Clostridia bacterium]
MAKKHKADSDSLFETAGERKNSGKADGASKRKKRKKRSRGIGALVVFLILITAAAVIVRVYLFDTVKLTSGAMSPAYLRDDVILVSKRFDSAAISRGDTVYAYFQAGNCRLVRRVAGVPGDYVDAREDGKYLLYTDDREAQAEIFLGAAAKLDGGVIPPDAWLLLSDDMSVDSDGRTLGLVRTADIGGIPSGVIWPINRIRISDKGE